MDASEPGRAKSVDHAKVFPVRFAFAEKLQLVMVFVAHTVIVLIFVWRITLHMEHRLTSIEMGQKALHDTITEMKLDVRELRVGK